MSFDHGQPPTIYCVNKAKTPLGVLNTHNQPVPFGMLTAALDAYVRSALQPIWGCPAHVISAQSIPSNGWGLVFLDDADQADAEGYHDYTANGLPIGKVFVKTTLQAGDKVSVTASHELAEMLVDPAANLIASNEDGSMFYAYEICDAVEETDLAISGIPMSNFVFPSWFEGFRHGGSTKFDALGICKKPYELLSGGYIPVFQNGQWTQLFGSHDKKERFAREVRKGHRSEARAVRWMNRLRGPEATLESNPLGEYHHVQAAAPAAKEPETGSTAADSSVASDTPAADSVASQKTVRPATPNFSKRSTTR